MKNSSTVPTAGSQLRRQLMNEPNFNEKPGKIVFYDYTHKFEEIFRLKEDGSFYVNNIHYSSFVDYVLKKEGIA